LLSFLLSVSSYLSRQVCHHLFHLHSSVAI
jgi:hypothetical protein